MRIDWSTLALQAINVAVLVWLLARFLFKPVANIIAARQEAARTLLADAETAKLTAEHDREAVREERKALDLAHAQAIRTIDAQAAAEKAALLEAARAEVAQTRADAQAHFEHEAAERRREVEAGAVRLAADIAAKVLARLPRESKIASFVDGLAGAIAALPAASRDGLASADVPLTVSVPTEPTDAERTVVTEALSRAAGHPLRVEFAVVPSLIAGLELRGSHVVVSNHLRCDLDEIRASLADPDAKSTRLRS